MTSISISMPTAADNASASTAATTDGKEKANSRTRRNEKRQVEMGTISYSEMLALVSEVVDNLSFEVATAILEARMVIEPPVKVSLAGISGPTLAPDEEEGVEITAFASPVEEERSPQTWPEETKIYITEITTEIIADEASEEASLVRRSSSIYGTEKFDIYITEVTTEITAEEASSIDRTEKFDSYNTGITTENTTIIPAEEPFVEAPPVVILSRDPVLDQDKIRTFFQENAHDAVIIYGVRTFGANVSSGCIFTAAQIYNIAAGTALFNDNTKMAALTRPLNQTSTVAGVIPSARPLKPLEPISTHSVLSLNSKSFSSGRTCEMHEKLSVCRNVDPQCNSFGGMTSAMIRASWTSLPDSDKLQTEAVKTSTASRHRTDPTPFVYNVRLDENRFARPTLTITRAFWTSPLDPDKTKTESVKTSTAPRHRTDPTPFVYDVRLDDNRFVRPTLTVARALWAFASPFGSDKPTTAWAKASTASVQAPDSTPRISDTRATKSSNIPTTSRSTTSIGIEYSCTRTQTTFDVPLPQGVEPPSLAHDAIFPTPFLIPIKPLSKVETISSSSRPRDISFFAVLEDEKIGPVGDWETFMPFKGHVVFDPVPYFLCILFGFLLGIVQSLIWRM
ncbi:hypothetical protein HDU67_007267 [Dinochytrium kinnereticum]|nr:hypothetical protein HDU67_007267 [Dinochytrium kinnereticum]